MFDLYRTLAKTHRATPTWTRWISNRLSQLQHQLLQAPTASTARCPRRICTTSTSVAWSSSRSWSQSTEASEPSTQNTCTFSISVFSNTRSLFLFIHSFESIQMQLQFLSVETCKKDNLLWLFLFSLPFFFCIVCLFVPIYFIRLNIYIYIYSS